MGIDLLTIEGFPDYLAGSDGNIYSLKGVSPRILKEAPDGKGRYLHVTLREDGKSRIKLVHILVCSAFHGIRPTGCVVSHKDGNCRNNVPDNLIWETQQDNLLRRREHGTDDCGTKNSRAMFDDSQITQIRHWINEGVKLREIAQRIGCNERAIGKIKRGERYMR